MTTTFESAADVRAAFITPKATAEILASVDWCELVRKRIKHAIDGVKKTSCAVGFDHYAEVKWEMNDKLDHRPYSDEEFRVWLTVYTSAVQMVAAKELRPIGYSVDVDDNQHMVFISWDEQKKAEAEKPVTL